MRDFDSLGSGWLADEVLGLTESMTKVTPSAYNEENRYLPASVTSKPGYIRYSVNPFMREIVDCFDVESPVREVNLKKGVQITYSTALESGVLYYADYIGTVPIMYMTADKELAEARIENNFIPMFQQSDKGHVIQSSDVGNSRKTGQTKNHMQFAKGGYMVPFGAKNADKMRSFSIAILLKDEVDAWPLVVGRDGDPDSLSDARTDGYTNQAKIFRGSTPLISTTSVIQKQFLRGDQRVYRVLCKSCNFPQKLRWSHTNKENGVVGGFTWETDGGVLVLESVQYRCQNCGHGHYEHDKELLFSEENGAHWHPTARPADPFIRSYHLPALYSPVGMRPWWKCVSDYLGAYDPVADKVIDIPKYQVFYNNILAEPFEPMGSRITEREASAHKRTEYKFGQIPNQYAERVAPSKILFLQLNVDVHDSNLAVSVMGVCAEHVIFTIDYWRFERVEGESKCSEIDSPQWQRVRDLIEDKIYTADDGTEYGIMLTFVDAGYANDTVVTFCSEYDSGVYPTLGRDRPGKNQRIQEFSEFTTQGGTVGYKLVVDHYKDRLSSVLRRDWSGETVQPKYHFNAPTDTSKKQIKELTREVRREKTIPETGQIVHYWHRPGNVPNELWDLLVMTHAGTDIKAWSICIGHFELEKIDWPTFWQFASNPEYQHVFARTAKVA